MNKLIILVGISGSGKSTYAKQLVRESRGKVVRVNRDDIRGMLFSLGPDDHKAYYGREDLRQCEEMVTYNQWDAIYCGHVYRRNVVIDNTTLKISYLKEFIEELFDVFDVTVKVIDTPLDVCIERDSKRERVVGEDIIRRQHKQLQSLLGNPEFKELQEKYK